MTHNYKKISRLNATVAALLITFIVATTLTGCKTAATMSPTDNTKVVNQQSATPIPTIDYSKYSGLWLKELSLKDDYKYGMVLNIEVSKEGTLKGVVSDSTENVTHIANVDINGKIENNKFNMEFDNDGWDHSGTVSIDFKDNNVTLTIKYNSSSSTNNLWGIGEGSFPLINSDTKVERSLNDLKDGGLQVIENQCFPVMLENYGEVKLISGSKPEDVNTIVIFYLVDSNNKVLYRLPDFYGNQKGMFNEILALSFVDVNKDNLKDIVVIGNYQSSGDTPTKISSIYFQKGKEFISDNAFDKKMNDSFNNKDIATVVKYAKENYK
ncbi:MAG TPA: hypothetical protein VIK72_09240 [Clostridiaceae bacterium]